MTQFKVIDLGKYDAPAVEFVLDGKVDRWNEKSLRLALVNMELSGDGKSERAKLYAEALKVLASYTLAHKSIDEPSGKLDDTSFEGTYHHNYHYSSKEG